MTLSYLLDKSVVNMRSQNKSESTHWTREGKEPDYRFTLANERTFLAWLRTGLALLAGGLLLDQFASEFKHREMVLGLAFFLVSIAAVVSVGSYMRWRRNQIAMRLSSHLEHGVLILALAISLCGISAVVLALLVV